jgi:hypothetical protein
MSPHVLAILAAALAGGLAVYLFYATKPASYDEPKYVYLAGARVQQVSGHGASRVRIAVAAGALLACLTFVAGALSTLP